MTGSRMLIGGELRPAASGETIASINPATEEVLGHLPRGGAEDVDAAVAAAKGAFSAWRDRTWGERAKLLRAFAAKVRAAREELARLDTLDTGNPIAAMRRDVDKGAGALETFAGLAGALKGETLNTGPDVLDYTLREPYGVVGRLIPYNHPIAAAAGKLAAPLAAGNTIVLKPSERACLSVLRMGELAAEVFPPGVVNVVTGYGWEAGEALVAHPGVPRLAFIGSVPNGRAVYRAATDRIKEVTLELGGKNAFVAFGDVDIPRAAAAAVRSMNFTATTGQSCGSTSRLFVHESIARPFVDEVVARTGALRIGDPLDEATQLGPITYEEHYQRVRKAIAEALEEGARLRTGGGRPGGFDRGYYLQPTVFDEVHDAMAVARDEIFGPVLSVLVFSDFDEVVARVNDSDLGLTANVWTRDLGTAHRMARALEVGYVWVNGTGERPSGAPFGGYKLSGIGRESSLGELVSYTREKNVCVVM